MWLRVALLCVALGAAANAQTSMTVRELAAFMESAQKLHQGDKEIAEMLRKVKMTERLEDRDLEEIQSKGAGPKTAAILRQLRDSSTALPAPAPPAPKQVIAQIPAPNAEAQGKIVAEARDIALNYTRSLPNFICNQITRRYFDSSGTKTWHLSDTVNARLTFFEQKEDYKVVTVNNQPVTISLEQLGGTVSTGEFGTLLKELFSPESEAQFDWERWGTLRGRRTYVFQYRILQQNSRWHIVSQKTLEYVPGYHGLVYIDKDTNMVLRITQEAEGMPVSFPIQDVNLLLDYDFIKIGDNEYLLPLRASNTARQSRYLSKNDVEFRLYRRYGVETTIKDYETPTALPEDKTKEPPK